MTRTQAATDPVPTRATQRGLRRSQRRRQPLRAPRPAKTRVVERRYRQTIRRIDLWSVLKISICFYLFALVVLLAAGAVVWWIASTLGAVDSIEQFMGDLLQAPDFQFLSYRILRGATLIGLVVVCLLVVVTVIAAAFYNVFAELLGGIEVTVSEEEAGTR